MKKRLLIFVILIGLCANHSFAQEGIGTNQPHRSAALEIVSSKRGLLIPRFDIPDLSSAAPVTQPADALMVYNTGSTTDPGFYYWHEEPGQGPDNGYWQPIGLASADSISNFKITANDPIQIDTIASANDTIFQIGIKPGQDGQVLVSQVQSNNNIIYVWTDPGSFIKDYIGADNGLHRDLDAPSDSITVKLGGELVEPTTITTDPVNTLSIAGLDTITSADLSNYNVMVMDNNGLLKVIPPADITGGMADIEVKNGLTLDADTILLGGQLDRPTTITTTATNTLAIDGLSTPIGDHKILVAEDNGSTLRSISRSLSHTLTQNLIIDSQNLTGYTPYIQEIRIEADISALTSQDIDLTLPDPSNAKEQIITVTLTDANGIGDNTIDYYLNILDDQGATLTYGAMPYQSWVLKSNGTKWRIVSRN